MMEPAIGIARSDAVTPQALAGTGGAHDILIGMTVPLMGGKWQRDRIVLAEELRGPMVGAIARGGKVGIALSHSAAPVLALAGTGRITLAYDPARLPQARAALIAASAQGG